MWSLECQKTLIVPCNLSMDENYAKPSIVIYISIAYWKYGTKLGNISSIDEKLTAWVNGPVKKHNYHGWISFLPYALPFGRNSGLISRISFLLHNSVPFRFCHAYILKSWACVYPIAVMEVFLEL